MPASYSSVSCCEEHAKISEGVGTDEWTASVTLRCAWSNRWLLMADLVGNRRSWPHTGGKLIARSASSVPAPTYYVQDGQAAAYIDALVSVNYSSSGEEEDLVAESLEPTAEFLTLDYKRFRWGAANGDPLTEGEAPGKLLRSLALVRQLFKVESPLPGDLLTKIGYVNSSSYTSALLGLTFAKGTLLFQPPSLSRTITTDEVQAWNVTLKFMYKPETWNKYWRSKTQAYDEIFLVNGGKYLAYPEGDFSAFLF